MKKILNYSSHQVLKVIYHLCKAFILWYFDYYELPFKCDLDSYLSDPLEE